MGPTKSVHLNEDPAFHPDEALRFQDVSNREQTIENLSKKLVLGNGPFPWPGRLSLIILDVSFKSRPREKLAVCEVGKSLILARD